MDEDESEGSRLVARWKAARVDREREEVFRRIFDRYLPVLFYFFRKRRFSDTECEDLAQEVFLRVHKGLPEFRGEARFESWLFSIAANLYRNALRERSTQKRFTRTVSLDAPSDCGLGEHDLPRSGDRLPLDGILEDERKRLLRQAIHGLPPQMRRCVWLRVDAGLRYREIALVMGISIETVKAHLLQARQRLKAELGDYFSDLDF